MAKISNTSAYPNITPEASDFLILTDTSSSNATKTVTVQALADFIDGQVTLQEVLDAGNTATQSINLTGNIALSGDLTGSGNITRTGNLALTGDLTGSGNITRTGNVNVTGDISLVGNTSDVVLDGGLYTSSGVNDTKVAAPVGRVVILEPSGSSSNVSVSAANGTIVEGVADFKSEIKLNAVSGSTGQVPSSAGPGSPLVWRNVSSLLSLTATNIFIGDASGNAVASDFVLVDPAAVVPNPKVTLGKVGGTNYTLQLGAYRADVTHPFGDNNLSYGANALLKSAATGTHNTALGLASSEEILAGLRNTTLGFESGKNIQNNNDNTLIGYQAGKGGGVGLVGSNNVVIGSGALATGNVSDSVVIGKGASSSDTAVAIGQGSNADEACIALGRQAAATIKIAGNPMLAISSAVATAMKTNYIFPTNTAALAAGLVAGDIYVVGTSPLPAGNAAQLGVVY